MHIEITLDRRKEDFLETPHINVVTVPTIDKYTLGSELVTNAQILSRYIVGVSSAAYDRRVVHTRASLKCLYSDRTFGCHDDLWWLIPVDLMHQCFDNIERRSFVSDDMARRHASALNAFNETQACFETLANI